MPRSRAKSDRAIRLAGGNVAGAGVAFIARVEGARTEAQARKKLASIVGRAGANPLWSRDGSVQVRVYFNPDLARALGKDELPKELEIPEEGQKPQQAHARGRRP